MLLLLPLLYGCVHRQCGELEIGGDLAAFYVDDGEDLPLTGRFKDECNARWTGGSGLGVGSSTGTGSASIYTLAAEDVWEGVDLAMFSFDWQHRKDRIDTNIALWWWTEGLAPLASVEDGATLGAEALAPILYYDPIISIGDGFTGTYPSLGAASEGELTILDLKIGGDACDRVEVKAAYDYTWGEVGGEDPWATASGEDWWHFQDPDFYCARRTAESP